MKKIALVTFLLICLSMFLSACGPAATPPAATEDGKLSDSSISPSEPAAPADAMEKPLKVVNYINGELGDKSFFDSAARGLEMAIIDFGLTGKSVEGGYDQSRWETDLEELSSGDWDIIIVGSWSMVEALQTIAPKHLDKKYIIYDTEVDYSLGNLENVYSILFKQNDGSFLAGALAGLITTSDLPLANPEKKIGFLGAMDIPVIADSLVAYQQGAKYVDPEIEVLVSYVGAFDDPATGKEMTLAQFAQGSDICINPASQSGLGVFDAAQELNRYAIGYDSDQYLMFKNSDPEKASKIVTSMMKNVDKAIYRAIEMYKKGELTFGKTESLGIKEGGVGLADNENYQSIVPEKFRTKIKELEEKIVSGEIVVETAFK